MTFLATPLWHYWRNTPIPNFTNKSPTELMMNHKLCDCVPTNPMMLDDEKDYEFILLDTMRKNNYKSNFDQRNKENMFGSKVRSGRTKD